MNREDPTVEPPIVIRAKSPEPDGKAPADLSPAHHRPVAWEDDISTNALDELPFENLPSPGKLPKEAFGDELYQAVSELLETDSLDQWLDRDIFPIPSLQDREGYYPERPGNWWLSGLRDYIQIMNTARRRRTKVRSYLDMGCSTGRLIRHFCAQGEVEAQGAVEEVWGSDINERSIRWLQEYLPQNVKPFTSSTIPTLPIPDKSVDVVSAFSVFTHIDVFESAWLAELARVIAARGFAFVTVHNEDTWIGLRDEIDNPDNRLVQSMIRLDPETPDKLQKDMPNTRIIYRMTDLGPYRSQVFHSNAYIHRVWGRYFNVSRIIPRNHAHQALVVLFAK